MSLDSKQLKASKILLVEDDAQIASLIISHLKDEGLEVTHSADGDNGLLQALSGRFDLVILDVIVPGKSGFEICKKLDSMERPPRRIMLTSRSDETDRVLGFELGADDYVVKPFGIREFVARVKAVLRREVSSSAKRQVSVGDLLIDCASRAVRLGEKEIELTATEFDLLAFMASQPGVAFNREQLLNAVWGYRYSGYEHTVNSHINRLRGKIESDPAKPKFIQTVWGVGYRCVGQGSAESSR